MLSFHYYQPSNASIQKFGLTFGKCTQQFGDIAWSINFSFNVAIWYHSIKFKQENYNGNNDTDNITHIAYLLLVSVFV